MKSTRRTTIASAVVLSLLVLGMVQVAGQSNQSSSTNGASTLIQLAQAAQSYAQQLLIIGQQQKVNVTDAQALITQGSALLTQAQNEVNTNSTQASADALSSMNYFHKAAIELQSEVVVSVSLANEEAYIQKAIQTEENRTAQLQGIADKACSAQNASVSICADINANLSGARADLNNASELLSSIIPSNAQTTIAAIQSVFKDTMSKLQNVANDLQMLAGQGREQKAVAYVENQLIPRIAQLQAAAQKANLTSTQNQQVQGLLSQATALLNGAIQSFQSGNFTAGIGQATKAQSDMMDANIIIQANAMAAYIQNKLIPQVEALQQVAQNANVSASVKQTVQSQLSQALSLLNGAVQSFQSGHASTGMQQVQQAEQQVQQAQQELQGH